MLTSPLPGAEDKVSDAVRENEGEAFMEMMGVNASLTGKET